MLLAQPVQGMVLSKSIYRTIGTIVGVVAAVAITALFPQDRTMILAAFTLWIALCTAVATVLRDFRAYGTVLAGYSVAIVSITNIDSPTATFPAAIDRVAAILVGIVAIALVNALLIDAEASRSLLSRLRGATADLIHLANQVLDRRAPPAPGTCVAVAARIMPLRSQITFATPELPDGRQRAKGARSALLAQFELLSSIQAVGIGLDRAAPAAPLVEDATVLVRRALRSQRPERFQPDLEALAARQIEAGTLTLEEAYVFDRMHYLVETLGALRDGLMSVRTGRSPRRDVAVPLHQDGLSILLNFTRVIVALCVVCVLGVWSGQAASAQAVLFTAVYVALGSINPNPSAMGNAAIVGLPITVLLATVYKFLIFPVIAGFPLFILSLAPLILATCYLMMIGQQGLGAIFGTMTIVLIAPANPQALDPSTFVSDAVMFILSGVIIFLSFRLVIPVRPEQRRLRLALAVGTNLRKALADEHRLPQPRASLHYDRLIQFEQWLGAAAPTLAHRKTLTRLSDIGNLAFAVRRAWRALDRAAAFVPPALDARARALLPTLSPDETEAMARDYLALAAGRTGAPGFALLHAAAALYGTALVTDKEAALLRRVELLRRGTVLSGGTASRPDDAARPVCVPGHGP